MIRKICGVKKSSWLCPEAAWSSRRASRHVADGCCVPGEATRTPKIGDLTSSVCLEMEDGCARGKPEGGRRGKVEKLQKKRVQTEQGLYLEGTTCGGEEFRVLNVRPSFRVLQGGRAGGRGLPCIQGQTRVLLGFTKTSQSFGEATAVFSPRSFWI